MDGRGRTIKAVAEARRLLTDVGLSLADAGVTVRSVAAEVLLMLPSDFTEQYELLWLRCHAGSLGEAREEPNQVARSRQVDVRLSSNSSTTMRPAGVGKKKGAGRTPGVRDERALATKQRIDRKLRKIGREIRIMVDEQYEGSGIRRCTRPSCRKYAEAEWTFCPYDGSPTEEVDR